MGAERGPEANGPLGGGTRRLMLIGSSPGAPAVCARASRTRPTLSTIANHAVQTTACQAVSMAPRPLWTTGGVEAVLDE